MKIAMIVAMDQNRGIGYKNQLLYWLPNDLKHFKALTTGHTIIMGRKTFESLPKGALPKRRNIVLSRQKNLSFNQTELFSSLKEALHHCSKEEKIFIIGGASLYEEAMPVAETLYITHIHDGSKKADVFFPKIKTKEWEITQQEKHEADDRHEQAYTFTTYCKII